MNRHCSRRTLTPTAVALAGLAGPVLLGCPVGPPNPEQEVHWLRFAQITDVHSTDAESPARAVRIARFPRFTRSEIVVKYPFEG